MQQVDTARQAIAYINHNISSIGMGGMSGNISAQPIQQSLQSLTTAVQALASAIEELDRRTKTKQ